MSASKFTFQSRNKDLKATCPMKCCRIVVSENMSFASMTITKQRTRSLRLKLSELSLKWRTVVFTAARGLPELATTLEKLNCFHSEYRRGYQSKLLTEHSKGERCYCWGSLRRDDRRSPLKRKSALSMYVFNTVIWTFLQKKKARLQKHRQLIWCLLSLFCFFNIAVYWSVRQVKEFLFYYFATWLLYFYRADLEVLVIHVQFSHYCC